MTNQSYLYCQATSEAVELFDLELDGTEYETNPAEGYSSASLYSYLAFHKDTCDPARPLAIVQTKDLDKYILSYDTNSHTSRLNNDLISILIWNKGNHIHLLERRKKPKNSRHST